MRIININTGQIDAATSLKDELSVLDASEMVVVFVDTKMDLEGPESDLVSHVRQSGADILFGSSAAFPYPMKGINLYFWKYYPRKETPYSFLYPKVFAGTVSKIEDLLDELSKSIKHGSQSLFDTEDIDPFQRYYIDNSFSPSHSKVKIAIDHDQQIFGVSSGRESMYKWPFINDRHRSIFYHYEKVHHAQFPNLVSWDLRMINNKVANVKTQKQPFFIPSTDSKEGEKSFFKSFRAYIHSLFSILKVGIFNLGKRPDYKIFRYASNHGSGMKTAIDTIIGKLESQTPFSFSHFNDGELTFIKKYLNENHKEVWFGRRQNKYNKPLGERLLKALTLNKENYFVGIPCKKCHPKLHKIAKEIRDEDDFTLPAMTLHHNMSRFPEILSLLKKRKLYLVVNESQDLSFFEDLGLEYEASSIIKIPFKNSHSEYEKLATRTFSDGAVVMMMCGMLAKILAPVWFEKNPKTSFITFGSAFDDYIQKNISFNLYPKNIPYSKHIIGSRFFLFGYKKKCYSCYNLKQP